MTRLLFATAFLLTTLTGVAVNDARDSRLTLLVFKGVNCPPCVTFVNAYSHPWDSRLRDAINDRFRMRSFYAADQPDLAARHHVDRYPTFIVLDRECRVVDRVHGFTGGGPLMAQLTDGHNPYAQSAPRAEAPPPRRTQPSPPPAEAPQDSGASQVINKLNEANQQLQKEREYLRRNLRAAEEQLTRDSQAAANKAAAMQAESDRLKQQLQQQRQSAAQPPTLPEPERPPPHSPDGRELARGERTVDEGDMPDWLRDQLQSGAPKVSPPANTPPPNISAEIPTGESDTVSGWRSLGRKALATGITLAAPQYAIPLSIATGIAGCVIRRRQQRKAGQRPAALGSSSNPITMHEPAATKTETKYVVTESDVLGEAYREAVRRVGNSHRERMPGIVDVLKQIDEAATHIAHGQRVVRRPKAQSQSETLP